MKIEDSPDYSPRAGQSGNETRAPLARGGYRGSSLGAEEPPSPSYHLLQKSLCLHYHQPLSSLYMLDSVCQTPL